MKIERRGVYTLIVHVKKESKLNIGKLGPIKFTSGFYAYNGSALGIGNTGLEGRINRHLKKIKKSFWHIDYLLRSKNSDIKAVVYTNIEKKLECLLSKRLKKEDHVEPIDHFGASDCNNGCGAHLFSFENEDFLSVFKKVIRIYNDLKLDPVFKSINPTTCLQ